MRKFLIKTAFALGFVAAVHLLTLLLADGTIDPFYLRFTTPRQRSLVIGTSRAAQGILPEVLNPALADTSFERPVYNFSFTLMHSPFGRVYLEAIRDKLVPEVRNGLFIVAVDPFAVASSSPDPEDESAFRENGHWLDRMPSVNGTRPNLSYFMHMRTGWGAALAGKIGHAFRPTKLLHEDGWLEVTVPMDRVLVEKRIKNKIADFERNIKRFRPSAVRRLYFEKTVRYLKQHGRVFIVRPPAIGEIVALEDRLMPGFGEWVGAVSRRQGVPFFDFSPRGGDYTFIDGSHLHKDSGRRFTRDIAAEIRRRLASTQ